jgi:ABC-type Fe3+/spermidine/putrescine transport system ATPase subunit
MPTTARAPCLLIESSGEPNTEVVVTIPPKAIGLSGTPRLHEANALDGVVADSTFLSDIFDYHVDIAGFLLRVQADRHILFEPGHKVQLSIAAQECIVVPGQEAHRSAASSTLPAKAAAEDKILVSPGVGEAK